MATEQERNRGLGAYSTPGVDPKADPGLAKIITSAPEVKFRFHDLDPANNLYMTRDDIFQFDIANSLAGQFAGFDYRQLQPDGSIHRGAFGFFPTSDRLVNTFNFIPGEGFMLNVVLAAQSNATKRGQTFGGLRIKYGNIASGQTVGFLTCGYLAGTLNLVWPISPPAYQTDGPGFIRSITGTTPAAGAEISETVPTNARWRLRMFRTNLVTSATVATRTTTLFFDDGANLLWQNTQGPTQAASLGQSLDWSDLSIDSPVTASNALMAFMPQPILTAGYRIRTSTVNLQAGDQYSAPQYQVEEWIET